MKCLNEPSILGLTRDLIERRIVRSQARRMSDILDSGHALATGASEAYSPTKGSS